MTEVLASRFGDFLFNTEQQRAHESVSSRTVKIYFLFI